MPGHRYTDEKEFQGRKYHGMRVGGIHRWSYPDGTWKERKATPSDWGVVFTLHKRRLSKAPRGSGAGVGSEYHWLLVCEQWARKEDANTYSTVMEGKKFLVAFKKPEWPVWNTEFRNQRPAREKVIKLLEAYLERLRSQDANHENPWNVETFEGLALDQSETEPAAVILTDLVERRKASRAPARTRRHGTRPIRVT